jgi:hypothetical protein
MKQTILSIIILLVVITSCSKPQDPFGISKQNVGFLNDSTLVGDLKTIFPNDSIVNPIDGDDFAGSSSDIIVFEKGGKQLLVLSPAQSLDQTSTIRTVRVIDERFKTEKGLNSKSTFKDIKDNYKISGIENTLGSIIVSVDEINAYFTIARSELPAELRFDMDAKIEAIQIPETAKIKNFFIQWY